MTAEVLVLNREAVAIAADSAVTLRDPDPKIYNTANKLFQLSAVEPVAIMVYGSAAFGPIPWETVVKEHRRRLATETFDTVEQYASSFITDLSSLVSHYSARTQADLVRRIAHVALAEVCNRANEIIDELDEDDDSFDDADRSHILMEVMASQIAHLQTVPCIDRVSASVAGRQIGSAIPDWNNYLRESFTRFTTNSSLNRRARALVRTALRSVSPNPWTSGVVVVGFGSDQLFPAFSHYVVDGVVANRVRARHLDSAQINEDSSAQIRAFAQGDMVQTFMDGLHPMYPEALRGLVKRTLDLLVERSNTKMHGVLSDTDYEDHVAELLEIVSAVVEHFEQDLHDLLQKKHSDPIMSIVSLLPKEELAEMAETLVSLTSFKRRMTPEAETVGGPIDVAVISKGDGLVWVKRKHYFDRNLNLRYFERDRRLYTTSNVEEDSNGS
ncbi:MAG: hypothetical protein OXC06_04615 [Acidimicrobiaceae bacterium]|nr:hypothetical protein [Acidimicrobiaceae bacterium]